MTSLDKISLPKLKGSENYKIWNARAKAALIREDLYDPIQHPDLRSNDSKKKNNKALAIIKLLCDDGPLLYIRNIEEANKAWYKLQELYDPHGFTSEYLTLKDFFETNLNDSESMETYLNKVRSLNDELRSKEIILPHQVVTSWILHNLNEDYDTFVQNIIQTLRKDPKAYPLDSLFAHLIDESRGKDSTGKLLVLSKKNRSKNGSKSGPKKGSNRFRNDSKAYKKKPYGLYCSNCKKTNHRTEDCYFLFRDKAPKNWVFKDTKTSDSKISKHTKKSNKNKENKEQSEKQKAMISKILADSSDEGTSDGMHTVCMNTPMNANTEQTNTTTTNTIVDPMLLDTTDSDWMLDTAEDLEVCLPLISLHRAANNKSLDHLVKSYQIGPKVDFILDTAATVNTICDLKYFYAYEKCNTPVSWGNANSLRAKYKGNVLLRYNTGYIYMLTNVYYIPELGLNLISQGRSKDIMTIYTQNKAILYNIYPRKPIAIAHMQNALYYLNATILYPKGNTDDTSSSNTTKKITQNIEHNIKQNIKQNTEHNIKQNILKSICPTYADHDQIINTWHKRLGHINIIPLISYLNTLGIHISDQSIKKFMQHKCKTCLLSKYNRHIHKTSINPIQYDVLGRIHSDLGGPLPSTHDKYKYYITFLDKKSRYLWVTLLSDKSNAYKAFEQFKALVENNTQNKRIHELFTDNGKEYINKHFRIALNKYGILHRTSPNYTKEPNGLIERINLTLFNKVRSLLIYSNSPKYLWGEALLAAVYLYNRTPHKSLGFKTPYEIYHKITPNITNIRIWGSICYYHSNTYIDKLSPRKEEAILIGYSDYNHYKLWDYKKRKAFWSRDVTICENQFIEHKDKIDLHTDLNKDKDLHLDPNKDKDPQDKENTTRDSTKTRSYTKRIAADPTHRVEVQIPSNNIYYTIKDTLLSTYIGSFDLDQDRTKGFLLTTSILSEPNTFAEAMNSSEKNEWYKACVEEIKEIEKQNTYTIIEKPSNIIPIKGRWVFKKKPITNPNSNKNYITNKDNTIRYKARWVIQGFHQRLGIDFLETFSTTCRTENWHLLLIIAVNKGWNIIQYDVKNAFIHADIDANIYTILPIGIYDSKDNRVCHLNKALYGLKQSPRLWYKYLSKILNNFDFKALPYDEGIYINTITKCILICHVDDILVIHSDITYIKQLFNNIKQYVKLEEIGPISTFLGNNITIDYQNKKLYINQTKYTEKLLSKFNIYNNTQYKPIQIPGQPGVKLKKSTTTASLEDIKEYQKQIGSLLFSALKTRPDITFPVIYCSRYMSNPNKEHFHALDYIWKYLLAYPNIGLIYDCTGEDLFIKGYCDSDWANDLDQRKSTSGYIFSLSSDLGINNPISWNSQLQKTIALSSCEAEYMALKDATKEAIYISNTFNYVNTKLELGYTTSKPKILVDSNSAKKLAENPEFHKRTKHIEIIYHFTREAIQKQRIEIIHIPSKYQLADFLTKNVTNVLHKSFIELANLGNIT